MMGGEREGASSLSEVWARFCRFRGLLLFLPFACGRRANMVERNGPGLGCGVEGSAAGSKSRAVDYLRYYVPERSAWSGRWCAAEQRNEMHEEDWAVFAL
jgi:hypothetical protein